MRIIHIFGASGSGTTTLGEALARTLEIPHLDSDDFYWQKTDPPYREKVPPNDRVDAILARAHEDVVLSGSLCSWGDRLVPLFRAAIFVRLEPGIRMKRLLAREKKRNGSRIEPSGDLYQDHLDFMAWAAQYDEGKPPLRSLALHRLWMQALPCPVLELDGEPPTEVLCEKSRNFLKRC